MRFDQRQFLTWDLLLSPNGTDVYVLFGETGNYLAMLERSTVTGKLTVRKLFENSIYGMSSPRTLSLSTDGSYLYVGDQRGIATFTTGRSPISTVAENAFSTIPRTLTVEQNYPNPFSTIRHSSTTIYYEIPATTNGALPVELAIYNIQGQRVQTLVNEAKLPGRYSISWNGIASQGESVPSGVYFYRIKAGESVATQRLLIIK
jgi:DNA-binding beta-propeller fold protein YncE